jgi:hypothetical protein
MAVPAEDLVPRAGLLPAFRAGLAHAWRCRVPLLLVLVAQIVFGATVALPLHARWKASLGTHAHAPALGGHPDALDAAAGVPGSVDGVLLRDLRRVDAPFHEGLSLAFAWVCLAAWVFGAFAAGGFLATADAPPRPFGRRVESWRFLEGGGRWFWRCLRVSLGFAVAYAILGRLLLEAWPAAVERSERDAVSDVVRFRGPIVREAAFLVGFLLLRTVADVARARVVVLRRRSAVLALFRSATSVARHPLRTIGLVVLSGALEAVLLLAAWALLSVADTGSALDVSIAFLAFQAAVLFRWGARAACLGGLVHLQHAHAGLPLREPDPDRRARRAPVPAPAA